MSSSSSGSSSIFSGVKPYTDPDFDDPHVTSWVVNVVTKLYLNEDVNLQKVVLSFPYVSYQPEKITALVMRIGRCTGLIYSNGKICFAQDGLGMAAVIYAHTYRLLLQTLEPTKLFEFLDFSWVNVVMSGACQHYIDLASLQQRLAEEHYMVLYSPGMFPGATIHTDHCVVCAFNTGFYNSMGLTSPADVQCISRAVQKLLAAFRTPEKPETSASTRYQSRISAMENKNQNDLDTHEALLQLASPEGGADFLHQLLSRALPRPTDAQRRQQQRRARGSRATGATRTPSRRGHSGSERPRDGGAAARPRAPTASRPEVVII